MSRLFDLHDLAGLKGEIEWLSLNSREVLYRKENGVTIDTVGGIIAAAVALQYDSNKIFDLCSQYFRRFFDFTLPIISLIKGRKLKRTLRVPLVTRGLKIYLFPFFVSPQT